jgi:hypothetical protein
MSRPIAAGSRRGIARALSRYALPGHAGSRARFRRRSLRQRSRSVHDRSARLPLRIGGRQHATPEPGPAQSQWRQPSPPSELCAREPLEDFVSPSTPWTRPRPPDQEAWDGGCSTRLAPRLSRFTERATACGLTTPQTGSPLRLYHSRRFAPGGQTRRLGVATARGAASLDVLLEHLSVADLIRAGRSSTRRPASTRPSAWPSWRTLGIALAEITFIDDQVNQLERVAPLGVRTVLAGGATTPRESTPAAALSRGRAAPRSFWCCWTETEMRESALSWNVSGLRACAREPRWLRRR